MDVRRVGRAAVVVAVVLAAVAAVGLAVLGRWISGTPVDDGSFQLDPEPARRELDALLVGADPSGWDVRVRELPGRSRTNGGLMGGSGGSDASALAELRRPGVPPERTMALARRVHRAAVGRGWIPVVEEDRSPRPACDELVWGRPGPSPGLAVLSAAGQGRPAAEAPLQLAVWSFVESRSGRSPVPSPAPGSSSVAAPQVTAPPSAALDCFERWVRRSR